MSVTEQQSQFASALADAAGGVPVAVPPPSAPVTALQSSFALLPLLPAATQAHLVACFYASIVEAVRRRRTRSDVF